MLIIISLQLELYHVVKYNGIENNKPTSKKKLLVFNTFEGDWLRSSDPLFQL